MFEVWLIANGKLIGVDVQIGGGTKLGKTEVPVARVSFTDEAGLNVTVYFDKISGMWASTGRPTPDGFKYENPYCFHCVADSFHHYRDDRDNHDHIVMFGEDKGKIYRLISDNGEVRLAQVRHPREGELYC